MIQTKIKSQCIFFVLFNVKVFRASSMHDVRYFFENFWHFYSQSSFYSVQTAMEGPFHVTASHKPFPHEKKAPLLGESLWVQSLPHFPSFCLSSFPQLCHWLIHLKSSVPGTDWPGIQHAGEVSQPQAATCSLFWWQNPAFEVPSLMFVQFSDMGFYLASMPRFGPVYTRYYRLILGWKPCLSLASPYIPAAWLTMKRPPRYFPRFQVTCIRSPIVGWCLYFSLDPLWPITCKEHNQTVIFLGYS